MSDCDVTRFLFSRALRSVVMLSSQKISNDMKTKTVSQESLSCKICKTLTNRANCNWWKCRICPSVYVCDACMSSNVSNTHHDETHEMIRCVRSSVLECWRDVQYISSNTTSIIHVHSKFNCTLDYDVPNRYRFLQQRR